MSDAVCLHEDPTVTNWRTGHAGTHEHCACGLSRELLEIELWEDAEGNARRAEIWSAWAPTPVELQRVDRNLLGKRGGPAGS
jgi:hypothetical protein